MDGVSVSTSSPLQRLATYVKNALPAAGYDIQEGKRTGDTRRLAETTQTIAARYGEEAEGLDEGDISRLLRAERMPRPRKLFPLAQALNVDYRELLVEAGIIPPEVLAKTDTPSVPSRPTPDEVAAAWGIDDAVGREMVRAMYDRLTQKPPTDDTDTAPGSTQAQG